MPRIMKTLISFFVLFLCLISVSLAQSNDSTALNANQKIKVFPNPATNIINVLGLQNSNGAFINVSDVYGNTVLEHQWAIKNNAVNIPIANLEKGIYLITIRTNEKTIQTKFYKQ